MEIKNPCVTVSVETEGRFPRYSPENATQGISKNQTNQSRSNCCAGKPEKLFLKTKTGPGFITFSSILLRLP